MNTNGSFGHWLRERRKSLDLTQVDLADQVGCSQDTVRKIEADKRRPSKQIAERMADVLAIASEERARFIHFARRMSERTSNNVPSDDLTRTKRHLPLQSTPFIGREPELAQIADCLADPGCRLLTLVGAGGMGKTRLAVQAAERAEVFTDGVYFVSLTPLGVTTFIASAIASALDFSFYGTESPEVQVVNYLRGKHLLLVMDNYEHLLGGIGLLADILLKAPRLKIIVTSRERLNLLEEWVLLVEGLSFPQEVAEDVDRYSAVKLFMQTARRVQSGFSLDDNRADVVDICRAVEGMPLGIELAATWLRAMPSQQVAEQIKGDLDFLTTPLRNVEVRHRSLRAVFEHSWSLLTDTERDVVMNLSVFRGGCDAEAAAQVTGASLVVLAGLVDKSLVRINAAGRYEMQELLRQFAADKLAQSGENDETQRRHFQFYVELAEQLEQRIFGAQGLVTLDRYEIEHDNFRTGLDWAARMGDAEAGLRLAGALGWFWLWRSNWTESRNWLQTFLTASQNTTSQARAKAIHQLIEILWEIGDSEIPVTLISEALRQAAEVEDLRLKAWLHFNLGSIATAQSEWKTHLETALTLFRNLGDTWGICETLCRFAFQLFVQEEDFAQAAELHDEGVRLARQAGDTCSLANLLFLSGCRHWYQGSHNDQLIEDLYVESLALFREMGYKNGIALALDCLGNVTHHRGDDEQAKAYFENSLVLSQSLGNLTAVSNGVTRLAELICGHSEPARAVRLLAAVSDAPQPQLVGTEPKDQRGGLEHWQILARAHAQLSEVEFESAYAEGRRMTLDEAVALALG